MTLDELIAAHTRRKGNFEVEPEPGKEWRIPFQKMARLVHFAGASEAELKACRDAIRDNHAQMMGPFAIIGFFFGVILLLVSFFAPGFSGYSPLYAFLAAGFLVILILATTLPKRYPNTTYPLVYLFLAVAYTFGILMGTVFDPNSQATVFIALLLILPLLFAERPLRMNVFLAVVTASFCAMAVAFKTPDVCRVDIYDAVAFYVLAAIANLIVSSAKINSQVLSERVLRMGITDILTGLGNRRAFEEAMEVLDAHQDEVGPVTVLSIDINGLKDVNDTKGHAAGDELLKGAAQCMVAAFRGGHLYRLGGDEFAALIEGSPMQVEAMLAGFRGRMASWKSDFGTTMSAAIGMAAINEDGADMDAVMSIADKRMYEDKAAYYRQAGNDRRARRN